MKEATRRLADALTAENGFVLVVTGAGVSYASGIETFRGTDPQAVWKVSDVETATVRFFYDRPVDQWTWYLQRFRKVDEARPNAAHHALSSLESWCEETGREFLVVTQNIDCLHEAAGSERLIKVHGTSDRLRCSASGCEFGAPHGSLERRATDIERFRQQPSLESLPRCPACNSLLRAHVLFFDEFYGEHVDYRFPEVERAALEANLVLFVGTSFSVGVTDLILRAAAARQAPQFSIDPGGAPPPLRAVHSLQHPAEELLPAVCARLGITPGPGPRSSP